MIQTMRKMKKTMLNNLVQSSRFSNFIIIVVLVNSIVLGLQTSPSITEHIGHFLNILDKVCLYIFVLEALIKISSFRLKYFKNGWNCFDFLIVLFSLLADFPALSSLRVLRIIRVFRAFKLISGTKHLQTIVSVIGKSIPSISWTILLLLIIYYVFAIIGTTLFGEVFSAWFGSIGKSMYSLFQIMTLESWSMGISRPVMNVYPYAWAFFIPFILITSFVVLNVLVGIVVNSFGEITSSKSQITTKEKVFLKEIEIIKHHLDNLETMVEKNEEHAELLNHTNKLRK